MKTDEELADISRRLSEIEPADTAENFESTLESWNSGGRYIDAELREIEEIISILEAAIEVAED
tara:strand:- start:510 stop:701 length:192 start_codon:yes stop_codon:yes gene_type:complete